MKIKKAILAATLGTGLFSATSAHAGYIFTDLSAFGLFRSINNSGQIAGISRTNDSSVGIWQASILNGTTITNLGTYGVHSFAHDINNAGQAVGVSTIRPGAIAPLKPPYGMALPSLLTWVSIA